MFKCKNCVVGLLSVCNDYCRPEREILIQEILQSATQRGHVLVEFVKVKGQPIWQAQCIRCKKTVAINLNPQPGQSLIYGEAATAKCSDAGNGTGSDKGTLHG